MSITDLWWPIKSSRVVLVRKVFFLVSRFCAHTSVATKTNVKNVIDIFSFNKNYPSKTHDVPVSIIKQVIISTTWKSICYARINIWIDIRVFLVRIRAYVCNIDLLLHFLLLNARFERFVKFKLWTWQTAHPTLPSPIFTAKKLLIYIALIKNSTVKFLR